MKDIIGNELRKGDQVAVHLDMNKMGLVIARIEDLREGGLDLSLGKGNPRGTSPAQLRLIIDITLTADPHLPVFPVIGRLANPLADEAIKKLADEPPSGEPLQFPMPS